MGNRGWMLPAIVLAGAVGACGERGSPLQPIEQLPRQLTLAESTLAESSNVFGFELLKREHAQADGPNVFLSPLSASMALGMLLNGTSGETWEGIRSTLGVGSLGEIEIDSGYRGLIDLLRGLDPRVDFRIANSVWTDQTFPILPDFGQSVADWFDAEARALDFHSPSSADVINGWVKENTGGRIPEIVPVPIPDGMLAFLINAIYFKATWTARFDPDLTRTETFTRADGSRIDVSMMWAEGSYPFVQTPDYSAVELGYGGGAYTMTVVLPREGHPLQDVVASLTPASWAELLASMDSTNLRLGLPRFRITWNAYLNRSLGDMGMSRAFSAMAELDRLTPEDGACVEYVQQKTWVEVNEKGTEAAAVTVVGIGVTSAPASPPELRIDHPFVVAIRERFSGTILFLGVVGDPTAETSPEPQVPTPGC